MKKGILKKLSLYIFSLALIVSAGLSVFNKKTNAQAEENLALSYIPVAGTKGEEISLTSFEIDSFETALTSGLKLPEIIFNLQASEFKDKYNEGEKITTSTIQSGVVKVTQTVTKRYSVVVGLTTEKINNNTFSTENLDSFIYKTMTLPFYRARAKAGESNYANYINSWGTVYAFGRYQNEEYSSIFKGSSNSFYKDGFLGNIILEANILRLQNLINTNNLSYNVDDLYLDNLDVDLNCFIVCVEETNIEDDSVIFEPATPYELRSCGAIYFNYNIADEARYILSSKYDEEGGWAGGYVVQNCCAWANLPTKTSGETASVEVVYREMTSPTTYDEKTLSLAVPWEQAFYKSKVEKQIQNQLNKKSYTDFNAIYRDYEALESGEVDLFSERIIYQATGYTYEYNPETFTGTVTVEYTDFFAKDFAIEIKSNDPEDPLVIFIYSTAVSSLNGKTTLEFIYHTIEEQLYNQKSWLVELNEQVFSVNGSSNNVTINFDSEKLTITVNEDDQNKLSDIQISAVAEIIEDVDVKVTYDYLNFIVSDEGIIKEQKTSLPISMRYSEVVKLSGDDFITRYQTVLTSEIPTLLGPSRTDYVKPSNAQKITIEKGVEYKYVLEYSYNMIFRVCFDGQVSYVPVSKGQSSHKLEDLNVNIPQNRRIATFSATDGARVIINEKNIKDSLIETENTYQDKIANVVIETTDKFYVKVNYLERFRQTPFAYATSKTKEVYVSEIKTDDADVQAFVATVLEKSTLKLLKSNVDNITVDFNGIDTYEYTIKYTETAIRQVDYNGNNKYEVKVPLTAYKTWRESFGAGWTILYLNMPKSEYFEYTRIDLPNGETVSEDNLYGYFSMAVFKERVTDLNYYFRGFSGDGIVSLYESKGVAGTGLYRHITKLKNATDNVFIEAFIYNPILAFCEIRNAGEAQYTAYFFYLDCAVNSNEAFISNGKADSVDDTDNAIGNTVENAGDKITSIFVKEDKKLTAFTVVLIVLGVIGAIVIIKKLFK